MKETRLPAIPSRSEDPVAQWSSGSPEAPSPWIAYISPTNLCNCLCRVCAHTELMRRPRGRMKLVLFKRIVDELPASIRKVYLMKQGEPLLNDELPAMAKYLKERRREIHLALHTNGIRATAARMKELLPFVDSLGISLSAIDAETYRAVHGVNRFDRVMANLGSLHALLEKSGPRPRVFIDFVRQQGNAGTADGKVVRFFRKHFPGFSSVDTHYVFNFQGAIEEGNLRIYDRLPQRRFPRCVFPWSSITFTYDGRISYCFVEPRENVFLGDITGQSFSEIWNGEPYRRFRSHMAKKNFSRLEKDGIFCRRCSWLWNTRTQSPRNLVSGFSLAPPAAPPFPSLTELLEMEAGDIFRRAFAFYASGEILKAEALFGFLSGREAQDDILRPAGEMLRRCRRALDLYRDLPLWREHLAREPLDMSNRYHPLPGGEKVRKGDPGAGGK